MSDPKESSKTKKMQSIRNTVPPERRAKGTKLPPGNPRVVAEKFDANKLPANLKALYEKIEEKGKEGVKLSTLCPKNAAEGKYRRWLVRQLVKLGALQVVPEPEPKTKAGRTGSPRAPRSPKHKKAKATPKDLMAGVKKTAAAKKPQAPATHLAVVA